MKWEYFEVLTDASGVLTLKSGEKIPLFPEHANKLGQLGWELVTSTVLECKSSKQSTDGRYNFSADKYISYVFKRELRVS